MRSYMCWSHEYDRSLAGSIPISAIESRYAAEEFFERIWDCDSPSSMNISVLDLQTGEVTTHDVNVEHEPVFTAMRGRPPRKVEVAEAVVLGLIIAAGGEP